MQYFCVTIPPAVRPTLLWQVDIHNGICNLPTDYRKHEGGSSTNKSAQELTWRTRETVLHPALLGDQTQGLWIGNLMLYHWATYGPLTADVGIWLCVWWQIGTDPREGRFWLKEFLNVNQKKPFAVVEVDPDVFANSAQVMFSHRTELTLSLSLSPNFWVVALLLLGLVWFVCIGICLRFFCCV